MSDLLETKDAFRHIMRNKLKDVSNADIEVAIAKCMADLVSSKTDFDGYKFFCKIERIDYEVKGHHKETKIELVISEEYIKKQSDKKEQDVKSQPEDIPF